MEKDKPILIEDYLTHEYTVHYWKNMTLANFIRSDIMTPKIRYLIAYMNLKK